MAAYKYRAKKYYSEIEMREIYFVERTHPLYGFPAVQIPKQPKFISFSQAEEYARKLNGESEQLKLF